MNKGKRIAPLLIAFAMLFTGILSKEKSQNQIRFCRKQPFRKQKDCICGKGKESKAGNNSKSHA